MHVQNLIATVSLDKINAKALLLRGFGILYICTLIAPHFLISPYFYNFNFYLKAQLYMKQLFTYFVLVFLSISLTTNALPANNTIWQHIDKSEAPSTRLMMIHPTSYLVYQLNADALRTQLFTLSTNPANGIVISLPMPDGSFRDFKVWQTPMMPDALAAQYPAIKTFTAEAVNDRRVTAKLDFTLFGFHAAFYDNENMSFIDPYDNLNDGYYVVHYKKDMSSPMSHRMHCEMKGDDELNHAGGVMETMESLLPATDLSTLKVLDPQGHISSTRADGDVLHEMSAITSNGTNLRTYRLALSANSFYCQAATGLGSPTIGQCFSAMTTSMNRVNGVYNREIAVQLNFCADENLIIWPTATGSPNGPDPFAAINSNASSCLSTNQTECDTRVGSADYDIGHVFTTGAGGLAGLAVICNSTQKARGVTGSSSPVGDNFDIDYVCHEMGHQFGSNHTFNNNVDGSCNGNASSANAYEPASGATIMDYAGICSGDNVQPHSAPYFSARSLIVIQAHMAGSGGACAVTSSTAHPIPTMTPFIAIHNIPYKTPFELTSPTATVGAMDTAVTYGWHQWNLGSFGLRLNQTFVLGPIFRSYQPVYTPTRVFPRLSDVLSGVLSNSGEKAADTTRFMTFKTVVRNIFNGNGCFTIPDDTIHINAYTTGPGNAYAGFRVTSQNTTGITYTGGSTQTVTWNVVGSNLAPVSCANVDIYMSTDGGLTWPYTVSGGPFPNNGTASIAVPNPPVSSTTCRFKVKGNGNVFFNVNSQNFTVNPGAATAPITGTFTVCAGATTTLADATPGGTWSSSTPSVATVGSLTGIVTGVSAGTATITYTAGTGPVTAVVTVSATPAPGAISGGGSVCVGLTTALSNSTPGGTWASSNTAVATVNSAGVVTGVATGTTNITYSVTNACGTGIAALTVTVGTTTAVAPITGTMSLCSGANTTLSNTTPGGVWSSTNPSVATITSGGVVTGVTAGTTTISYSVTVSGCTSASTAVVTVTGAIPDVTISVAPNDTVCTGNSATYTAIPVNGGATPSYQWSVNGTMVATGPSFSHIPANGDMVTVQMTTSASCVSTPVVTSAPLTMSVQAPTVNTVTISASSSSINVGDNVTFVAIALNAGPGATYQWYINSIEVPGATNVTFTTNTLSNGQVVHCKVTSTQPCVTPKIALSGGFTMVVVSGIWEVTATGGSFTLNPNPNNGTFTISGRGTAMQGNDVQITVTNVLGQSVYTSTAAFRNGRMEQQINLPAGLSSGIYMATVTSGTERVVFRVVLDK